MHDPDIEQTTMHWAVMAVQGTCEKEMMQLTDIGTGFHFLA
jgi:hypothetical protein